MLNSGFELASEKNKEILFPGKKKIRPFNVEIKYINRYKSRW